MQTELFDPIWDTRDVRRSLVRLLGKGRGAIARLVQVADASGGSSLYAEKVFRPGLFTRLIYWFFYQSPFPYRSSQDAILACYYRRKVVSKLMAFAGLDLAIAAASYVRWSEEDKAFVLGTEFIDGRGLAVDALDDRVLRRFVRNYLVSAFKQLTGRGYETEPAPTSEARALIGSMKALEKLLRQSGLVGSGWQVTPGTLISTANFLKQGSQFVLVDLESGIPALFVPYYLFYALFTGRFPLFDDVDEQRLRKFCTLNEVALRACLGDEGYHGLQEDVEALVQYSRQWKGGEIAVFRNHVRLRSPGRRQYIKAARVDWWVREGILDDMGRQKILASQRFFFTGMYLLGVFPGSLGRFLRRLHGNHTFRAHCKTCLISKEVRQAVMAQYLLSQTRKWQHEQRIPQETVLTRIGGRFMVHLLLSRTTPQGVHRFVTDRAYRTHVLTTAYLLLTSATFQTEYAKRVICESLREWENDGRLDSETCLRVQEGVEDGSMHEYLRGFGFHASLKLLQPLTSGIKAVGLGWFFQSFMIIYPDLDPQGPFTLRLFTALVGTLVHNPVPVVLLLNTSVLRTLITLWRMLRIRRQHISYKVALVVGVLPACGSLAFPMQMYRSCRELATFLIRHILAKLAQKIPIYGGKHTRLEVWFVRLANIPLEVMHVMHTIDFSGRFRRHRAHARDTSRAARFDRRGGARTG